MILLKKIKNLQNIPESAILITADVVGLYPSIPHEAGLNVLKKALDNRENDIIPADNLIKMTLFVLKNNYFEFYGEAKNQLLGTVIRTKFTRIHVSIYMNKLESNFLKSE